MKRVEKRGSRGRFILSKVNYLSMSSVEETDFSPKCENCDQVVEYVNEEGLCETCEEEHVIAIYEARNDRDWEKIKKIP